MVGYPESLTGTSTDASFAFPLPPAAWGIHLFSDCGAVPPSLFHGGNCAHCIQGVFFVSCWVHFLLSPSLISLLDVGIPHRSIVHLPTAGVDISDDWQLCAYGELAWINEGFMLMLMLPALPLLF